MKKTIFLTLLILSFIPSFCFATPQVPEDFDQAQEEAQGFWENIKEEFIQNIKDIWNNQVIPFWQQILDWFEANIWPEIYSWFNDGVRPQIEEEFEKEKEQMKEELPEVSKSLWERFKELIK